MASFSFPILDVANIVSTMREFIPDIDINDNDFSRPKTDRWEAIYKSVLMGATHCCMETLFQPHLEGLSHLDHVELYEKTVPLLHLLKAMQKLLNVCLMDDFSLDDIIDPKPGRLRKICSALVNYIRFLSERQPIVQHIRDMSEAGAEQREALMKDKDELQREINQLKAARSQRQPEITQVKERIEEVTGTLQTLQQDVAARKRESDDIKTQIAFNKTKLAKAQEGIAVATEESNRLSGLIVQSPDRMKADMDRMHAQLSKLKLDKDDKMRKLVDVKRMREQIAQRQADCETGLKLLTDINQQAEAEKKVLSEIGNIRDQAQGKKEQLSNLQVEEKQKRRILTSKQEKLAKMSLQHESKVNSIQEDVRILQQKINQMQSIHSAEESEVAKIQSHRHKLAKTAEEEAQKHTSDVTMLAKKYSELLEQLDAYHNRLGETWQGLKAETERSSEDAIV